MSAHAKCACSFSLQMGSVNQTRLDFDGFRNIFDLYGTISLRYWGLDTVCLLFKNHVFLGTRIDRKIAARDIFYRSVLPAHLFR
jgi:hypothetical protein